MTTPRVYTYHCAYCSNLFLASTHDFAGLPKRKDPGLDHATIVPLPPPPKSEEESDSSSSEDDSSSDEEEEPEDPEKPEEPEDSEKAPANSEEKPSPNSEDTAPPTTTFDPSATTLVEDTEVTKGGAGGAPPPQKSVSKQREKDDYTLILSLSKDRAAKIITREDGFEKRWIWRCGRCRLVTGYQLDDAHFANPNSTAHPNTIVASGIMGDDPGAVDNDKSEKEKRRIERKRKRYLYILPGAVLPTEELGRELGKREVDILGEDV